jgi:ABC-type transporter Mla MlaB component
VPGQGHTIRVGDDKGKHVTFTVSGRIALDNLESFISEIQDRLRQMIPASLTVDLAGVEYLDRAGALALIELESHARGRSVTFEFTNLTDKVELLSVAQAFNTNAMVYQPRRFQSQSYNYSRWRANPGYLVTDYLIRDLRESRLFQAVFGPDRGDKYRFKLEGGVAEFQELDASDG